MNEREVNYEELYHKMVNATEDAMRILIQAQQECEELYLQAGDQEKTENSQAIG